MEQNTEKTVIVTDSGFGGLSVLAGTYEELREHRFSFPLHLFFVEALPKNCPGYPWQGYSLMPDRETQLKVFHNFLSGLERHFRPDMIALVCNTLSAIVRDTDYYAEYGHKILNIMDIGLEECSRLQVKENACMIILGTQTTISSGIHHRGLAEKRIFPPDRIIPLAFAPEDNYPLLIETEPDSPKTWEITRRTLAKAFPFIPSPDSPVYVYLGCTHFGFVQHQYIRTLQDAGFPNVKIVNPNTAMTRKLAGYIRDMETGEAEEPSYPLCTEIYSQFVLSSAQTDSGTSLISAISPAIAEKLRHYIFKNDITESWKE